MKVLIPRERVAGETRVAATPETVERMARAGLEVAVESGAGAGALISDQAYGRAGARIVTEAGAELRSADVVLRVAPPSAAEVALLAPGAAVIGFMAPQRNLDVVRILAEREVTALAMELVPRITRAQKMDALSSQASIGGYKAVLLAAGRLHKYFPMLMTAAGTTSAAKVVVMGAGVAGLQAVATARRLGAVVWVSDVRPAVKEQVQSLGGKFIDLPVQSEGQGGYAGELGQEALRRQQEIIAGHIASADVVITTAQVPGRPAPRLVTAAMVEAMRPGSVIVDLAAEQGGNCELTVPGEEVVHQGVLIIGALNLPATVPLDASNLYSRNVLEMLLAVTVDGKLAVDPGDEVVGGSLLTYRGRIVHAPTVAAVAAIGDGDPERSAYRSAPEAHP